MAYTGSLGGALGGVVKSLAGSIARPFTQPTRTQITPGQSLGNTYQATNRPPPNPYPGYLAASQAAATARNAPLAAGLNQAYTGLGQQMNLTNQQYGNQQAGLNANYGFDSRSLGVKNEALGLDRNALDRQDPQLQSRLQMAQQMRGFLEPELDARNAETWRNMDVDKFRLQAETRSRGAMGSEGYRVDDKDISDKAQFGVDELYRSYQRDVLRANDDITGSWENIQKNKDAKAQLSLQAKQLGIDGERLASSLQLGLQRLGLDQQMSVNELLQRMNSNRTDYQMLGQKIFDQALQMTPIFQSASYLPPAMQASLMGGR